MSVRRISGIMMAMGALAAISACASAPAGEGAGAWRKLTQVEKRFAIFMNDPVPAPVDGIATFRFVYVYAPGAVQHEGHEVGWQEYSAMMVDCAQDKVKVGPRLRYGADGAVLTSDDNQEYADIIGPAIARAAEVSCKGITSPEQVLIPDGPGWRDAARVNIAASEPF